MAGTRRTRKASGGKRKKSAVNSTMTGGKRKASPWNKFVKKVFSEPDVNAIPATVKY